MIINKDFDAFKNILEDKDKSKILLGAPNWFFYLCLFKNPWKKILFEENKITIPFIASDWFYNADFIREKETNQIQIKNSKAGSFFWLFANKYIVKRMMKNWDKATI